MGISVILPFDEKKERAAEGGQVISCHTIEAWNEQLQKGNDSNKLIVVDFTASWYVDELNQVSQDWAVESMPTFIFLKEGKIVDKVVGAKKEELQQNIEKHVAASAVSAS
ncbi:Thioredoxin [Quillaja saponaria]|uniref:Thioredoxin n=1 Tax=Quillaja saponaria TaxID=32244 RepID=A0AAD7P6T2_QUISA|nr:Thioredoxin [Quillaja saponaria]